MQRAVNYILNAHFNEFIASYGEIDVSQWDCVTLNDLRLKHEIMCCGKGNTDSGVELTGGRIGSLVFKAAELGKIQVVASDVVFDFDIDPMKAIGNVMWSARNASEASKPGFVRPVHDSQVSQWGNLLGQCVSSPAGSDFLPPLYCAAHHDNERRRRSSARVTNCKRCSLAVQTNYVQCALCPACSRQGLCVICGDSEVVQSRREREEYLAARVRDFDIDRQESDAQSMSRGFSSMLQCVSAAESLKTRQIPKHVGPSVRLGDTLNKTQAPKQFWDTEQYSLEDKFVFNPETATSDSFNLKSDIALDRHLRPSTKVDRSQTWPPWQFGISGDLDAHPASIPYVGGAIPISIPNVDGALPHSMDVRHPALATCPPSPSMNLGGPFGPSSVASCPVHAVEEHIVLAPRRGPSVIAFHSAQVDETENTADWLDVPPWTDSSDGVGSYTGDGLDELIRVAGPRVAKHNAPPRPPILSFVREEHSAQNDAYDSESYLCSESSAVTL